MKPQQILNWQSREILSTLQNKEIESWLLEKGPITERNRTSSNLKLEVLKDEFAPIDSINDDLIKDKPLGDIIFSEPNISREIFLYAKFQYQHQEIWGRKIIYTVNNYPFSIAEVFIIPE